MTTTKTRATSSLSQMIVLLLSVATAACGELTPDELAAQDTAAPNSVPSLADEAPAMDTRQPPLPGLSEPEVAGEPTAAPAPSDSAALIVSGAELPVGGDLALRPLKGEGSEPAPRDLIPGDQPATGASELPPVTEPAPEHPVCDQQCPAGTTLDVATCDCSPGNR